MDKDNELEAKKLFDEAENYFKQNDYFNAIMCLEKAKEINPNDVELYNTLYDTYSNQEEYVKASEHFKSAIENNPNDSELYKNLGVCYVEQKKYDEAIVQFKEAINILPTYAEAYNNLGTSYYEQKKYDDAIKQYKKAIEINPNHVTAYNNLGTSYHGQKKYDEAIEHYKKAITINSNNAVIYNNLGVCYDDQANYDEAIEQYRKAISINPNDAVIYSNLGISYDNQDYYDEAIEQYKNAMDINPTDEWIYKRLNYIYYFKEENTDELLKNIVRYCSNLNNGNQTVSGILKLLMEFLPKSTLKNCYEIIFKDDIIFKNDKIFKNIIGKQSNEYEDYKEIWFYQAYLLEKMAYKESNKDVVHYTSYSTLMHLIGDNDEEDISKVRLNSLSTANDNEEGHTLIHIFRDLNIHIQQSENTNLVPFQTSFSKNKDSLTMFRLYGKEGDKEATGVCLVFNNDFFTNDTSIDQQPVKLLSPFDEEKSIEKVTKENPKRSLYHILYYNPDDKQLLFNRKETKHGQNEIINLGDNSANDIGEIQECFNRILEIINGATDKQTCYDLLINLKYLIKSDYWLEETELRLIEIADLDDPDNDIKTDEFNNKLYKEYLDVFGSDKKNPYLKAIILGSKIENAESKAQVIKRWLVEKGYTSIDVSVSKAPLR